MHLLHQEVEVLRPCFAFWLQFAWLVMQYSVSQEMAAICCCCLYCKTNDQYFVAKPRFTLVAITYVDLLAARICANKFNAQPVVTHDTCN